VECVEHGRRVRSVEVPARGLARDVVEHERDPVVAVDRGVQRVEQPWRLHGGRQLGHDLGLEAVQLEGCLVARA
jgi:hypothetical protein